MVDFRSRIQNARREKNNYALFLFLGWMSFFWGLYGLFCLKSQMLAGSLIESIYLLLSILANPFYLALFAFPFLALLYRLLPNLLFHLFFFPFLGCLWIYAELQQRALNHYGLPTSWLFWDLESESLLWPMLGLSWKDLVFKLLVLQVLLLCWGGLLRWMQGSVHSIRFERYFKSDWNKLNLILLLLLIFTLDKFTFAWLEYHQKPAPLYAKQVIPFYLSWDLSHRFQAMGIAPAQTPESLRDLALSKSKYPLALPDLRLGEQAPRQLVWILVAGPLPPFPEELKTKGISLNQHLSAGDDQETNLFSLLYGLSPHLKEPVLASGTLPLLPQVLQDLGYQLRLGSQTTLPLWVEQAFAKAEKSQDLPLLLAPSPSGPSFSLLALGHLSGWQTPGPLVQDGAQGWAQWLSGWLASLEPQGTWPQTLVMVTGLQAQASSGPWGLKELTQPLWVFCPACPARLNQKPTAHQDLVPTWFHFLGKTSPPSGWSTGTSLLVPEVDRLLPARQGEDWLFLDQKYQFRFNPQSLWQGLEVTNAQGHSIGIEDRVIDNYGQALLEQLQEEGRFLPTQSPKLP